MTYIRSLLIGIVCIGSLITKAPIAQAARPESVPLSILKEGCLPFQGRQCPAKMQCYVDVTYPKNGMCACRTDYLFTRVPPENTGLDVAPPLHRDDCVPMGWIQFVALLQFVIPCIFYLYMILNGCSMMKAVYRGGGLKFNSSCVALFANIMSCFGGFGRNIMYGILRANWIKDWKFFDFSYLFTDALEVAFTTWMVFECTCTWLDLWQKSASMSRRSSFLIVIVRNFFRIYSLLQCLTWLTIFLGIIEGVIISNIGAIAMTVNQAFMIAACGILSPLIARILCKNMKEVTNQNWKAASAIRNTGLNGVTVPFFVNISYRFFIWVGLFLNQAIQINHSSIFTFSTLHMFFMFSWHQYLQFAHRKYLKDFHTSRISEYCGFTTLGLQSYGKNSNP